MPRVIDRKILVEWFENACQKVWQPEYYAYVQALDDHPLFINGIETAYLLSQVNSQADVQIAAVLFMLEIPSADAPPFVASLLEQLTILKNISLLAESQEKSKETLRKMLLAMAGDVRSIVIIIAHQVVLMRHVKYEAEDIQRKTAKLTLDIFAPLANRLGLARFKWELEDGILRYLDPIAYRKLTLTLAEKRTDREQYIEDIITSLKEMIEQNGINGTISGRVKHLYSIWKKMTEKGREFSDLFDVRAVRIMVDDVADCYRVLGLVHEKWTPIPKEFDDYIANPKPNGYQSLHTAVLGPKNKTLEVQIRTKAMNEHAELGVAAHWHYKEGSAALDQQIKLNRVRQLIDQQAHESEVDEPVGQEIFTDKVYVLSPAGEAIELQNGSTPLDFAYQIHTNLGHRCRGAKVNGKIVPLTYQLNNGDTVDILTGKQLQPSRDWLSPHLAYVKSNRTRAKIRAWFKQQDQEKNSAAGKQLLDKELARLNIHLTTDALLKVVAKLNCNSLIELHTQLGSGDISINQLIVRLPTTDNKQQEITPDSLIRPKSKEVQSTGIHVRGVGSLLINIANCCKPAPPELIGGFITLNRGVSIHRTTCSNYLNMMEQNPERRIDVDWGFDAEQKVVSDLFVKAHQHNDLLKEISQLMADEHLRIVDMRMRYDADGLAILNFTLEINHLDQLSRLLDRLDQMPYVVEAQRV